jgi:integrase
MGCVRKSRGKWVLDYRDATGKRHIQVSGDNKKEAERQLRQILNQLDDGTFRPDGKKMKFSDYAKAWVASKKADLKHGTWNTYNGQLTRYLLSPELGLAEKKLASMNRPTVMAFKQALLEKHSKLSHRSVNHILTLLGSILQSALLDGYISINAARLVKKLPLEHREMEIFTPSEIQKVLAAAEKMNWDLYVMVFLLVMTGMRRGEMLGLDWKSVDFPNKKLIIRRGYTTKRLQEPKTKSSRRAVNLSSKVINLLKKHRLKKGNPGGSTLLFDRGDGYPMDPDTLSSVYWPRLLRAAEVRESVRLHDLRHTFCSLLIAQGANPKYIQGQLGHSSIMMTMDRYGHLMPETNEKETELLDETVFGKEKGSGYKLGTSD